MKITNRWLLIICLLLPLLNACQRQEPTLAEQYRGKTAAELFQMGEKSLAKKHYEDAIKYFEALDTLYPFSHFEAQAQIDVIYAYYRAAQYGSAAAAAKRFIHLYPRHPHVDYAYYMQGMANFEQDRGIFQRYIETNVSKRDLGTLQTSFHDFNRLIRRFPNSQYAADARQRMIYIRNLMAQHEINIANFYLERKAYVAAANRANYLMKHYQQAPQIIPALAILVKAYQALEQPELAQQSYALLAHNFPESNDYKQLKHQINLSHAKH